MTTVTSSHTFGCVFSLVSKETDENIYVGVGPRPEHDGPLPSSLRTEKRIKECVK